LPAKWIKRIALGTIAALAAATFLYALMPDPILVDTTVIEKQPLKVTVDEEGETRIREIYVVSAPIGGKVLRSPLDVGDDVVKDKTLAAVIQPEAPSFLDYRRRRELEAAVSAAEASIIFTESQIRRATSELEFARNELERTRSLASRGTVSQRSLEQAKMEVDVREAALSQAKANLELRKRELESAKARLIGPDQADDPDGGRVEVMAPESGRVLKIHKESEQVVQSGEPLVEIGNPHEIEIVVDLLSTDAVKVKPGAEALVEDWGGEGILKAKVRRVDPAGFTKVSALGIEEQRVNTILDITDPPEKWEDLGHDFRVFVRITVWQSDSTLTVPLSAMFRRNNQWAVFRLEDGAAKLTPLEIGRLGAERAQVLEGLSPGDRVLLHPSDRVLDGAAIRERNETDR